MIPMLVVTLVVVRDDLVNLSGVFLHVNNVKKKKNKIKQPFSLITGF